MGVRENIISASYDLFSTKGFNKTTISDIVTQAKASKGGFYHHFKSKEEIVSAIMDDYLNDFKQFYLALYDQYDDMSKIFTGVFYAIHDFKKEQMVRWPEMMKLFAFQGNEVIIAKMAKDFEQMTESFYIDILEKGNGKDWTVEHPKIIAGLWTREILRMYGQVTKTIYDWSDHSLQQLKNLVYFNEKLINDLLKTDHLTFADGIIDYAHIAKEKLDELTLT